MPYWQYVDGAIVALAFLAWFLLCLEHREEQESLAKSREAGEDLR